MNTSAISTHVPKASSAPMQASSPTVKLTESTNQALDPKSVPSDVVTKKVQLKPPEKVNLGYSAEEMRKNIQEAIDNLNQQLKDNGRDLSFRMDETINRPIITVRNNQTGEIVRQIPHEEVVRMAHSIEEGKGLLFNEYL